MRCIDTMILARATCTCKRCGKMFERKTRWWNDQKAREWEEWAAKNITLCPECRYDDYVAGAAKLAREASASRLAGAPGFGQADYMGGIHPGGTIGGCGAISER